MYVNGFHSPPWKHRRKSDPLHPPLHKERKKTAAQVDKEPINMQHHVDHGIATTDCSNNYPSSLQQGTC
jgi:hypothetical protein